MLKEIWKKIIGKKESEPAVLGQEKSSPLDAFKAFKGDRKEAFKMLRNPKIRQQMTALYQRMQAEGVDVRNEEQLKKWLLDHKDELEKPASRTDAPDVPKTAPIVHHGPQIGRNDPCHCGSGKKFKKCHGAS